MENRKKGGNYKHGMSRTPEHRAWTAMFARCKYTNIPRNKCYIEKNIKVCDRWKKFIHFYEDMGKRPPKYSLDRIDSNGNYEPSNCRWTDTVTQSNNRDCVTKHTFKGISKTLPQWSEYLGIKRSTLQMRYYSYGWSLAETLTIPIWGRRLKNNKKLT